MTSRPFVGICFCIRTKRREVFYFYEKLFTSSLKGQTKSIDERTRRIMVKITHEDGAFFMIIMVNVCGFSVLSLLPCERGEGLAVIALIASAFVFLVLGIGYLIKHQAGYASVNVSDDVGHREYML